MACDICGKTNCDLVKLHDIYRTDDICDICLDCEKIVDEHLRKIQASHGQAQKSLLKRFMAVMKLGE